MFNMVRVNKHKGSIMRLKIISMAVAATILSAPAYADVSVNTNQMTNAKAAQAEKAIREIHTFQQKLNLDTQTNQPESVIAEDKFKLDSASADLEVITGQKLTSFTEIKRGDTEAIVRKIQTDQQKLDSDVGARANDDTIRADRGALLSDKIDLKTAMSAAADLDKEAGDQK